MNNDRMIDYKEIIKLDPYLTQNQKHQFNINSCVNDKTQNIFKENIG